MSAALRQWEASVAAIAVGLNVDKIPTPRDHWAIKKGRATGGKTGGEKGRAKDAFNWNPAVIARMLRNESLLGWKMHKGNPVRTHRATRSWRRNSRS